MNEDLVRPKEAQYIQSFMTTASGGKVLLTANPYLLKRIHMAETLFVDTTFKRTAGPMNEWEVVMWDQETQRGMSTSVSPLIPSLILTSSHHLPCLW